MAFDYTDMDTLINNASSMCGTGDDSSTLIFGTTDGKICTYDYSTSTIKTLYAFQPKVSVIQITRQNNFIGVILQGVDGFDDDDNNAYLLDLNDLDKGPKHITSGVNFMITPFKLFFKDFSVYAEITYSEIKSVRRMDYFRGECRWDNLGDSLVINNYMSTASVYTLDLSDFDTWKIDTFSFESDLMREIDEYIEETPIAFDDIDEEIVMQEEILNSRLPASMVRSVHDKHTYLDFVKLYDSGIKDNPYVISGGRDRKVVITDFKSHTVYFEHIFDNIPRCCCHNQDKIFIGSDEGDIIVINKSDLTYSVISLGTERFRKIEAHPDGRYVVAVNLDNAIFCLDAVDMEVFGFETIEERVRHIVLKDDRVFIADASGTVVDIVF